MQLTPAQRTMIEVKIAEYLAIGAREDLRRAVASAHALPLCWDWSACMAIRPDGEVVWVEYDEPHRVRAIDDERVRNLGLFQGPRHDPDLQWLVPPRPADAVACTQCAGTGRVSFPPGHEHLNERIACYCSGSGWLPALAPLR